MMSFGDYLPHGLSTSSRKTSTPKGAGSAPPRRYLRAMLLEAIRAQDNRLHTPHASREPLPWYLVLGASSSGKTTLLCTLGTMVTPSTLPPHSSEGSTFACMWWPCAEAIFLETAGYYVTPAEEVHHRTEWEALVRLLRQYRLRAPIHGLLITVRADTLASQLEEQDLSTTAAAEAINIRTCLDLVVQQLRCAIPVYVLITCSDHIDGFTEFANSFPARTHQQVFGYVHPQWPSTDAPIEPMVTTLNERLRQLRLSLYAQEGALIDVHREKIWGFPEEMRALQIPLRAFLRTLFPADPWYHQQLFRGLFFCSARQDGPTFSFVRRQWQGMEQSDGGTRSKSYFLQDLLTTLLPRDRTPMRPHRRGCR